MKSILAFIIVVLAAYGSYYFYFGGGSLKNITIKDNTVIVDAGDFDAEFSMSGEFNETYMLFGGDVIKAKNIINSIVLSGLEITDAAAIYKQYPDFHLCKSAGAPLAQGKTHPLNLIPADKKALKELKSLIDEHEKNFAKGAERVCVTVTGKNLLSKSDTAAGKDSSEKMRIIHEIPREPFYLIYSSQRVDCKNILNQQ